MLSKRCLRQTNISHLYRTLATSSNNKVVVFDKDGTLLSFEKPWLAWCNRLQHRLVERTAEAVSARIGSTLGDMGVDMEKQHIGLGKFAEASQSEVRENITRSFQDTLLEISKDENLPKEIINSCREPGDGMYALTNVVELFESLESAGYKIAVATADSQDGVNMFLQANDAEKYVDFIMSACNTDFPPKPSKKSAEKLCETLDVDPANVVMVGDTPTDMLFGRNGGFGLVIGVTSGIGNKEDLTKAGADVVVDNVDKIPGLLKRNTPNATMRNTMSSRSYSTSCKARHSFGSTSGLRTPMTASGQQTRYMSTSSRKYESESKHDYVIVGAGSAGCVLANRLTEDGNSSVLSLEAGPKDTWLGSKLLMWKIHMPSALMFNLCDDKYNWYYHTTPQKHMDNRVMYWPRGRVWGGSSSLNAMVYIRGNALDYDRWQDEGASNWSYADCLPYFKKSTKHSLGEDDYRGGEGPVGVTRHPMDNPLYHAFIKAGQEAGYPYTDDLNGYQQEGVGPMDSTTWEGMRCSAAVGHLHDAVNSRPNLSGETGCMVTRVVIEGGKAVGVEYRQGGKLKFAAAEKDVILSGGAINTPQLLMLSGVGPAEHLADHNIPVHVNLPGVGENLQDHIEVYVQQECTKPITLYKWQQPHNMVRIGLQWFFNQTGKCSTAHLEAGGFIRSRPGVPHPDIQFHFLPSQVVDHGRGKIDYEAYQVHVGPMRATSRGWLKLKSADPSDHPIIEPNYLSTDTDIWEMRQCVKLSRELFAQPAFDDFRGKEIRPGSEFDTDEKIDAFVRQYGDSSYHPSCTCKMGKDDMSVVNPDNLRVYGVDNLRVVDASIMPSVVSGNLNGPTLMVAERSADIIRHGKALLPPSSHVPVYRPPTLDTQR